MISGLGAKRGHIKAHGPAFQVGPLSHGIFNHSRSRAHLGGPGLYCRVGSFSRRGLHGGALLLLPRGTGVRTRLLR